MQRELGVVGLAIVSLCACNTPADSTPTKPAETKPAPPPTSAPSAAPDHAPGFTPPYAEADLQALHAKFQGAWVIRSGQLGEKEAWLIEGDQVTITGPEGERRRRLEVVAPCDAGLTVDDLLSSTTNFFAFAFDGDKLYAGNSSAGVKRGDDIVACNLFGIYTFVAGQCFHWKEHLMDKGEWKQTALTCSFREVDGHQEFVADLPGSGQQTFRVEANALVHPSLDLDRSVAQRFPDIQAAKQALAAGSP